MNRFGAFAIHLGISLLIFAVLGYLIVFHWYPDFFFASDGGWQGIRIVALVDLVLGPTLTLVVFNRSKPFRELRRDLSIIALVQAVCLAAGVWVVYSERPVAMIFADGSFYSMSADDYLDYGQPVPDWSSFPDSPPHWISVKLPDDPLVQSDIRREALEAEIPVRTLSRFYEPFRPDDIDFSMHGYAADALRATEGMEQTLTVFEKQTASSIDEWRFIRFNTRYGFSLIAVHQADRRLRYVRLPQVREDSE